MLPWLKIIQSIEYSSQNKTKFSISIILKSEGTYSPFFMKLYSLNNLFETFKKNFFLY